ncbi:hypothetical protein [Halalkalibacter sp. APA_J-10(15)]|uniref:hypothetical protein n=1 Tax=unclassified Halalkalibacter TaxID=2893063 RepID=UPI001FF20177|nr:hypothetical protein [Halalkalibacter sp. APA_J-10(15)]MCK0470561.1 hypothetical protein [Halalkalibacter sp. APA_J-10(15)]
MLKTMKVNVPFHSYEDLTYKSGPFQRQLLRMRSDHQELKRFIQGELKQSEGAVIEGMLGAMNRQHASTIDMIDTYYDLIGQSMSDYSDYMNRMRRQDVLVYYEISNGALQ